MEILNAEELEETQEKKKCVCGCYISILQPHDRWRKVKCTCGQIWWVKPSGRVFERHFELKEFDY